MFNKIKKLFTRESSFLKQLKELDVINDSPIIADYQVLTQYLNETFKESSVIKQYLNDLFEYAQTQFMTTSKFYQNIKLLILFHLVFNTQKTRQIFSKMLLNQKGNLHLSDRQRQQQPNAQISQYYCQLSQIYFSYLYRLSSNTNLVLERHLKSQSNEIHGNVIISFTMSNQCHLGLSMIPELQQIQQQSNQKTILSIIIQLLYQDISDIYSFLTKEVRYQIQNIEEMENKSQTYELYKECLQLQDKLMHLYKLEIKYRNHKYVMPPASLFLEKNYVEQLFKENKQKSNNGGKLKEVKEEIEKFNEGSQTTRYKFSQGFIGKGLKQFNNEEQVKINKLINKGLSQQGDKGQSIEEENEDKDVNRNINEIKVCSQKEILQFNGEELEEKQKKMDELKVMSDINLVQIND